MKLSVIIPFCVEFPQNAFTVQSVYNEIRDIRQRGHDFEIIVIDNWCQQAAQQVKEKKFIPRHEDVMTFVNGIGEKVKGALRIHPELYEPYLAGLKLLESVAGRKQEILRTEDRGGQYLSGIAEGREWLKYCRYIQKLSHWQAKNAGIALASGDVFLFLDAHTVPSPRSIADAFEFYAENWEALNGTIHLPLSYLLEKDSGKLIYKFVGDPDNGHYDYSFTTYRDIRDVYEVDCMSTCGMFMHRSIYNALGGWPKEHGIYGGGEHFINYASAVLGYKKWIYSIHPNQSVYHYADTRGYNYMYDDYVRNKIISAFIYGDEPVARKFVNHLVKIGKGRQSVVEKMLEDIKVSCKGHRELIASRQVMSIEDWYYNTRPGNEIRSFLNKKV